MNDVVTAVGGFVAVVAAIIGVINSLRQSRTEERVARLGTELEAELHRRTALIDRELDAEDVLTRYREPLAAAAFDLQSRLYNILELDFLGLWGGSHPRAQDALQTTMFRFAQYFGWTEILRRDVQFLSFPEAEDTVKVARLQSQITRRFLTHEPSAALMIWSDEQRAIGEQMIVDDRGALRCMGYAPFSDACKTSFAPWCERLREELTDPVARDRMRELQHLLCDLIEVLDVKRVRYSADLTRA